MFAFTSLAILALALGVRADLVVDTPSSANQCQGVTFQITGSTPGPYHAFIVDSANPCGDQLDDVPNISGTSFTWTPPVGFSGKSVMIALENDDASVEAWSGAITIGAGDSSCGTSSSAPAAVVTTPAVVSTPHTTHAATTSVPVNAASNNDDSGNGTVSDDSSAASRVTVGVSGMLALVGAAVVTFAL